MLGATSLSQNDHGRATLRELLNSMSAHKNQHAAFVKRLKYVLYRTYMSADFRREASIELFPPDVIAARSCLKLPIYINRNERSSANWWEKRRTMAAIVRTPNYHQCSTLYRYKFKEWSITAVSEYKRHCRRPTTASTSVANESNIGGTDDTKSLQRKVDTFSTRFPEEEKYNKILA